MRDLSGEDSLTSHSSDSNLSRPRSASIGEPATRSPSNSSGFIALQRQADTDGFSPRMGVLAGQFHAQYALELCDADWTVCCAALSPPDEQQLQQLQQQQQEEAAPTPEANPSSSSTSTSSSPSTSTPSASAIAQTHRELLPASWPQATATVLATLLAEPGTRKSLIEFSRRSMVVENICFIQAAVLFRGLRSTAELLTTAKRIYGQFLSPSTPMQVNCPQRDLQRIEQVLKGFSILSPSFFDDGPDTRGRSGALTLSCPVPLRPGDLGDNVPSSTTLVSSENSFAASSPRSSAITTLLLCSEPSPLPLTTSPSMPRSPSIPASPRITASSSASELAPVMSSSSPCLLSSSSSSLLGDAPSSPATCPSPSPCISSSSSSSSSTAPVASTRTASDISNLFTIFDTVLVHVISLVGRDLLPKYRQFCENEQKAEAANPPTTLQPTHKRGLSLVKTFSGASILTYLRRKTEKEKQDR